MYRADIKSQKGVEQNSLPRAEIWPPTVESLSYEVGKENDNVGQLSLDARVGQARA